MLQTFYFSKRGCISNKEIWSWENSFVRILVALDRTLHSSALYFLHFLLSLSCGLRLYPLVIFTNILRFWVTRKRHYFKYKCRATILLWSRFDHAVPIYWKRLRLHSLLFAIPGITRSPTSWIAIQFREAWINVADNKLFDKAMHWRSKQKWYRK